MQMDTKNIRLSQVVKKQKYSARLPTSKSRESKERSAGKQLYKYLYHYFNKVVKTIEPEYMKNLWEREKIGSRFTVGPYQTGLNSLRINSISKLIEYVQNSDQNGLSVCQCKSINKTFIDVIKIASENKQIANSIVLNFGTQSLSPLEIMNKFKDRLEFCSINDFFNTLNNLVQMRSQNNDEVADLLQLNDDYQDLNYDKVINILEIMSLVNTYPGVSYEIFPISKLKIANVDLSHLLINKPMKPLKKLSTFKYGYLTIDHAKRFTPIPTNSC